MTATNNSNPYPTTEVSHVQTICFSSLPAATLPDNLSFAQKVLEKVATWPGSRKADEIVVITSPRRPTGMIEWHIMFRRDGKHYYTLAAIQRTPESEVEFCS